MGDWDSRGENPLFDTSGTFCGQRQVDRVWFLAGWFNTPPNPIVRTCNIPANMALFFPLIYTAYGAFLNDQPDQRTEAFVRSQATCNLTKYPVQINFTLDGATIPQPQRFFTGPSGSQSPFFNIQLPPDNILGGVPAPPVGPNQALIPELLLSPSAEQGYWVFLFPLPPGRHTIHWTASGCVADLSQDITYNLTVAN
jgi:hypothetical protein